MGKLNERMLIFYSQDRLPEKYISYAYSRNNPLRYKDPLGTKTAYIPEEIYYASYKKVIEWLMTTRLYKEYLFIRKIVWHLWKVYWNLNLLWGELEGVYGTFTPSTITLNEIYLKFPVSVSFWGIVLTLMHEGAHAVTWKLSMTRNEYITHVVSGWLIEMVMYTQYEENILFPKWKVEIHTFREFFYSIPQLFKGIPEEV